MLLDQREKNSVVKYAPVNGRAHSRAFRRSVAQGNVLGGGLAERARRDQVEFARVYLRPDLLG